MGVTGKGVKGNSFNTPQSGIRAQVQHLKAYAAKEGLNKACVDPRSKYVVRGCAEYVEWLGQKENPDGNGWEAGVGYGEKILDILKGILGTEGEAVFRPYLVRVSIPDLNIRKGPGTDKEKTGK